MYQRKGFTPICPGIWESMDGRLQLVHMKIGPRSEWQWELWTVEPKTGDRVEHLTYAITFGEIFRDFPVVYDCDSIMKLYL